MTKLELVTSELLGHLQKLSNEATEIYWITAFAMKSGVKLILPFLKKAADRGVPIKLLVGDYLYVTQPEALDLLVKDLPQAEIRLWKSGGTSFHPKSYLFRGTDQSYLIVGSSNLSASAMTRGVEWNLIAPSRVDETVFEEAVVQFMEHFYAEQTVPLNSETLKSYRERFNQANQSRPVSDAWSEAEEVEITIGPSQPQIVDDPPENYITSVEPRPAQQEALEALEQTMAEDYNRAMAVLATGLGKTYLAAFFAKTFKRVLFVAHRDEILQQARSSFSHVHPDKTSAFYNAAKKDTDADFIFASVFTLGSQHHLNHFEKDAFDLVVIDEFHHAAAPTYERLLKHFEPKFLLGITATPERMDNKDIYSLCDGNVAISIHFLDAIRRNWLAPFQYYGVYDDTDYSTVRWLGNRYDEEELLRVQLREEFAERIFERWQEYKQTRTIVFCSSIKQSQYMNQYFQEKGIRSMSLNGGTPANERRSARHRLESGELEAIFTVDLFNEGVDIPKTDTLLFIRPTESLTVYTQQIGRGLRLADGKSHCVIIDFIGNYRNADVKLSVFDTEPGTGKTKGKNEPVVPENCGLELDVAVVDLLEEFRKKRAPRKELLATAYQNLKQELGRRPTYLEFHLQANADARAVRQEFGSYFGMLLFAGELSGAETAIWGKFKLWFLEAERTGMTKSYKMVVLAAMLEKGSVHWYEPVTPEEIAPFFHRYLTEKEYRRLIDFNDKQGKKLRDYDEQGVADLVARMPMTKWSGSATEGLITFVQNQFVIHLEPSATEQEVLFEWTKQIADYRLHVYFGRKADRLL
ncbi:DEAD/DEAH box helicase family protein [Planococcus lenghuensis]|uniref:DNA helicase n=1 Tax=Planococcus lenghuensis TaxID=2213202 RepID=A0A1Q2L2U1_9BACL|nr:DEAD/DEAH box helicase family protein [Planococcus lenghuensis]AQQ54760.1 DNA helicase [Planococcus lenghuensis]